jgi:hypothetical protein
MYSYDVNSGNTGMSKVKVELFFFGGAVRKKTGSKG